MKFVTVMDMWLLILNIGLLGGLFYFGRKVLATLARISTINDRSINIPERSRIVKMINAELDTQKQMLSMGSDRDVQMTIDVLNELLDKINRK